MSRAIVEQKARTLYTKLRATILAVKPEVQPALWRKLRHALVKAERFATRDEDGAIVAIRLRETVPAVRRQIAQTIVRVLKLSVFPLRVRESNPIPAGWLPRVPKGSQKKQAIMYPGEADRFVASSAPLPVRLFAGFVAREGMRHDEAERLTWADIDRGIVRLDENKTDDPRSWALRPSVARALEAWRKISPRSDDSDLVFVTEEGERSACVPTSTATS